MFLKIQKMITKPEFHFSRSKIMDAGLGVKSVLQRSVWLRNKSFKENLMQITALCDETEITSYVQNLDDLREIIKLITPITKEFFNNCFLTSRVTKQINNINWEETDELLVKQSLNSGMSRADVSIEESRQNLNVETRALRVDWIKNPCYGFDYPSYGSIYKILRFNDDMTIFDTDFTRAIEDYCNDAMTQTVAYYVIIPYICYLLCGFIYLVYVVSKGHDDHLMSKS